MKPKIHLFNPGYESGIALYAVNGSTNYTPSGKVQKMRHDLSLLPVWFADPGDYVWIGNFKANHTGKNCSDIASFLPGEIPAFATLLSASEITDPAFQLLETEIAPWGLSPQSIRFFEEIKKVSGRPILIPAWNDRLTNLTGRKTAADCLEQLLKRFPEIPSHKPVFYSSLQEIEEHIVSHTPPYIIKTPYSSSGRGVYEVAANQLAENEKRWIAGALQKQGSVSIEPLLDKKIDFAMEYLLDKDQTIRFEGFSLFDTTPSGSYIGNRLSPQKEIEEHLSQSIGRKLLHQVKEAIGEIIKETYSGDYYGNIGVDMMIYTDTNGNPAIQPCVEINMRNTMGMLSVHLFKQFVAPSATGYFKVVYEKDAYAQHNDMQNNYPQQWEDDKLLKGYLPLCPVGPETLYRAYILIGN